MRFVPWLMPLRACSGTEPPESSSDAVDVRVQGQMLWTVEDAREEVNFPRRFSPLASPEPLVVSARASVSRAGAALGTGAACACPCVPAPPAACVPLLANPAPWNGSRSLHDLPLSTSAGSERSVLGRSRWLRRRRKGAVLPPSLPLHSHQVFLPRL